MSREHANIELIEKYLDGVLEGEDKIRFEEQLLQDEDLAEEVKLHQDIRQGILLFASASLKETLEQSDQNPDRFTYKAAPPKQTNLKDGHKLYSWMAVAASISTILLLGYLLLEDSFSDQSLVTAYYQTYPNILSPVDRSSSASEDALTQALYAYEREQYQEAIVLFEQHQGNMEGGHRFYYALSFFETNQPERTVEILETVVEEEANLFYHPALWYQALAYLKISQESKAKEKLSILTEEDNSYQQNAITLLEALD